MANPIRAVWPQKKMLFRWDADDLTLHLETQRLFDSGMDVDEALSACFAMGTQVSMSTEGSRIRLQRLICR